MIPKIIHFCWLSFDEYPKVIKKCIESWQNKLPDYEFVLWDTNKFDINSTTWTKQAFEAKQYAFAADYIRLHALYNYGGIYLDSDVEVLKTFDELLDLPYFVGLQCDNNIEAAIIGAQKGTDWIKGCLEHYDNKSFIKEDGSYNQEILPVVMRSQIKKYKKIIQLKSSEVQGIEILIEDKSSLFLFPSEYFSPKDHQTRQVFKTKNTYCIHHYNHSWFTLLNVIRLEVIKVIGLKTTEKIIGIVNMRKLISK
ncbi:glycosyl transferase [Psychroserpens burtonensis]|uniref:Glycosyl transferase n=1 Tax=Psychroserpens burtonensis TaxID=49278 RepID=A0A5C7B9Y3_9FLAO|nr:glycosyltransferase [Psychroserpens burtonensis]TXE18358.1 glycosyl transferase [Psychroserpens burtonensis]